MASTLLTITDTVTSPVVAASSIVNIDASKRTKAVKITGNTKNNSIVGGKKADTLIGGKGDDTLKGGAGNDVFYYSNGDGNDVITDYTTGDKIKIASGTIKSTSLRGSDVMVNVGSGSMKINNAKAKTIIINDSNNKTTNLIHGGATKDNLRGTASADSIFGNGGNDTLNGGKGNDTLTGGTGNDVFYYSSGDGNDVIMDYTAGQDKIMIASGTISKAVASGSDVVFNIGSGKLTVKNGKGKKISITNAAGLTKTTVVGGSTTSTSSKSTTQQDVIKKFMKALDETENHGEAALNEAIRACSSFTDIDKARNTFIAECEDAPDPDYFLLKNCGIILYNDDTGAITGWDAGGTSIKTSKSVIPEKGIRTSVKPGSSEVINGIKINYPSTGADGKTFTADEKLVMDSLHTWWIKEGLNLIADSYGDNFSFTNKSSSTLEYIDVEFFYEKSGIMAQTVNLALPKNIKNIVLRINMAMGQNLKKTDDNYQDMVRNVAHELTHAVMKANINDHDELPQFIQDGMAELTHGCDDGRGEEIYELASNSSQLQNALDLNTKGGDYSAYAGGYMFLRWLAKKASTVKTDSESSIKYGTDKNDKISGTSGKDVIWGGAGDDNINGGKDKDVLYGGKGDDTLNGDDGNDYLLGREGNDFLRGGSGNDTIRGGVDDDILYGEDGDDSLSGGTGSDTLDGGAGNDVLEIDGDDVLFGGSGKDTFVFVDGYDNNIKDYTPGEDVIQIGDDYAYNIALEGDNIIISLTRYDDDGIVDHEGKINIETGASKEVTIIRPNGKKYSCTLSDSTSVFRAYGNYDYEFEGTDDDDTLIGGEGNDTLSGNRGNDLFVYTGGNDIIKDYTRGDKIKIASIISYSTLRSGYDTIIKVGSGSIKLENCDISPTIIQSSSVNPKIEKSIDKLYEERGLEEPWFVKGDNIVGIADLTVDNLMSQSKDITNSNIDSLNELNSVASIVNNKFDIISYDSAKKLKDIYVKT